MNPARHSYFSEALTEPPHGLVLPLAILLTTYAVFSGRMGFLAAAAALEGGYLLLYPLWPPFRRKCQEAWARDDAQDRADELQRLSARLGDNAKARLRSLQRLRENLLTQLRAWPDGQRLELAWSPRLEELIQQGLRILLAIDSFAPNPRAAAFDEGEIARLEQEIAQASPGPAKEAKQQRLRMLQARAGRGPNLAEQREAAVVQLDTLEDLLEDLSRAALEGRDAAAFGARLEQVNALVDSMRQSIAALEAHAPQAAELAEAKRLGQ